MADTVVVTGAGDGLGAAVARAWGREGATVILGGRDPADLESIAGDVEMAGGEATILRTDARDEFDLERLVETAAREAGSIDVLVPAESVRHDPDGRNPLSSVSYSAFDDVLRTNLRGPFATITEAVPHLASDATILLFLPATDDEFDGSRPEAIAAAGRQGLVDVAAQDLDQTVVGIEHQGLDGDAGSEVAASVAEATVSVVQSSESVDGSLVSAETWDHDDTQTAG